ncbi:serine protease [Steroidobacter flavus]|uniref:Serine protease n=1 Tax=Steroidobacter flavus TaxID=1842136 RepID=A0ABV8T640_9GAMM
MQPFNAKLLRSLRLSALLFFMLSACVSAQNTPAPTPEARSAGSAPYQKALEIYSKRQNFPPKILNGVDAHYADFPWQVALVRADIPDNFYGHFCGGVLIGDGWVVTAAHCVDAGMTGGMLRVVVGTDRLQGDSLREEVEDHIAIPDDYDATNFRQDLALLRLKTARPHARISMLTSAEDTLTAPDPPNITALGWGYLYEWGLKSNQLKQISLALPTLDECKKTYKERISADMFCAGKSANGKDACKGDSGGAAVVKSADGSPRLAGLISWGLGCGKAKRYGVYARVSTFQQWIRQEQQKQLTTNAAQ